MEPEVVAYEATDNEDDAAHELSRQIKGLEITEPFVLASVHGATLAAPLPGKHATPPATADQRWASELGSQVHRAGCDAIVAVGGGRCIDLAKLVAARAGVAVIAAPTQLSHDGICSPVAVVPNETGRSESIGAAEPRLVFLSMPTIATAPVDSLRAGVGDLLANPLALRDWALAAERGVDEVDQRAWALSVESFERIKDDLDTDPSNYATTPGALRRLADALVLSGLAMIVAGTSRPASGGEHEISHAIDELHPRTALHGIQVAFGCIVSTHLYGEDVAALRARLSSLGLPTHPAELGLDRDAIIDVLLRAPETRPGRFTIIEHADLDRAGIEKLVEEIWG